MSIIQGLGSVQRLFRALDGRGGNQDVSAEGIGALIKQAATDVRRLPVVCSYLNALKRHPYTNIDCAAHWLDPEDSANLHGLTDLVRESPQSQERREAEKVIGTLYKKAEKCFDIFCTRSLSLITPDLRLLERKLGPHTELFHDEMGPVTYLLKTAGRAIAAVASSSPGALEVPMFSFSAATMDRKLWKKMSIAAQKRWALAHPKHEFATRYWKEREGRMAAKKGITAPKPKLKTNKKLKTEVVPLKLKPKKAQPKVVMHVPPVKTKKVKIDMPVTKESTQEKKGKGKTIPGVKPKDDKSKMPDHPELKMKGLEASKAVKQKQFTKLQAMRESANSKYGMTLQEAHESSKTMVQYLKAMWLVINDELFAGRMKMPSIFRIFKESARTRKLAHWAGGNKREIAFGARVFNAGETMLYETMVHEMCHQAVWELSPHSARFEDSHGATWRQWMRDCGQQPDVKWRGDNETLLPVEQQKKLKEGREAVQKLHGDGAVQVQFPESGMGVKVANPVTKEWSIGIIQGPTHLGKLWNFMSNPTPPFRWKVVEPKELFQLNEDEQFLVKTEAFRKGFSVMLHNS